MLKVLLVDDEPLARVEMKRLLGGIEDIEVVAEASNGKEALLLCQQLAPHLVFSDIKMPDMDGLEFAKLAPEGIHTVFCTAYSEHAVTAFELNAFDYVMKPVQAQRLESIINKVRLTLSPEASQADENYLDEQHGLMLKFGNKFTITNIAEISHIESVGNHVAIYTAEGKAYLHASLSKLEKRLDPNQFFKASRSHIIRTNQIAVLEEGAASGSLLAIMRCGSEIEISRRQASQLRQRFSLDNSL